MNDADTAILSVRGHVTDRDAPAWFVTLRDVAASATDWPDYASALRTGTNPADTGAVEAFVRVVGTLADPMAVVRELTEDPVASAARLAEFSAPDSTASDDADPRRLDWVTEAQRTTLVAGLGEHWTRVVLDTLDSTWPAWTESDDGSRRRYLTDWTPSIVSGSRDLLWTTEAQRTTLADGLGSEWSTAVLTALDEKWPAWTAADDDGRRGFLDDWAPTIIAEYAPAGSTTRVELTVPVEPAVSVDPREPTWVDQWQRSELAGALGPEWPAALLESLDRHWPQWTAATDDDRRGFLTGWLPTIIAEHPRAAESASGPVPEPAVEIVEEAVSVDRSVEAMSAAEIEALVARELRGRVEVPDDLSDEGYSTLVSEVMRELATTFRLS